MSKTYGLPGLRIGWVATRNAARYRRMEIPKGYTTICDSATGEFLAEIALRHRERIARRNRDFLSANPRILDGFLSRHADRFAWVRPAAGTVAFPRRLSGDAEAFCHEVVATKGVLLLPGFAFDDTGNHFRIGFGRADLPRAIARME